MAIDEAELPGEKSQSPEALRASVIDTPPTTPYPSLPMAALHLWQMAAIADDIEPWGRLYKLRDRQLRDFVQKEHYLNSALGIVCARNAGFSWKLEGPKTLTKKMQEVLQNADRGRGWDSLIMKVWQDTYSSDNGGYIETVRVPDTPEGELVALNALDSARAWRTGDPSQPVLYLDRKNKYHLLNFWQVQHVAEMPSPNEDLYDLQTCAVSRVLKGAQIIRNEMQYITERTGGRHNRAIYLMSGITTEMVQDALRTHSNLADQAGLTRYAQPPIVGSPDPHAAIKVEKIELASLPEGWDEEKTTKLYILVLAMAFMTDYQEFAPLPGGNLGTSAQSEVQHMKSRGKGPARYMTMMTHMLNVNVLPAAVEFTFDEQDLDADNKAAENRKIRSEDLVARVGAKILLPGEARKQMVDDGDLDQELFDASGGLDFEIEEPEPPPMPAPLQVVEQEENATATGGTVVPQEEPTPTQQKGVTGLEPGPFGSNGAATGTKYAGKGGMVAWRVPPNIGKQIALKGGEKPKAMHVTLAFIPDMEAATTAGLEDCLRIIGARTPALQGSIAGIGRFPASESSDGLDVIYAGVDVPGLAALRTEVVECLGSFAEISEAHDFTPHITLAYVEPSAPSPVVRLEPIAIEVDHLVLAAKGGTIAAHPLSGGVGEKQDDFAGPFDAEHRRDTAKLEEVVLKGLEAVYKNVRRRLREEVKATELALQFGFAAQSNALENGAVYEGSYDTTLSEKALQDVPFDEQFWAQQKPVFFKEVPTGVLQEIIGDGVYFQPQALGLIGNFDLVNEEVLGFVNGYTDTWWAQLTKTTRNTLRKAIEASISNGEPLSALVKAIEPTFGRSRANMIAVSEVTRMYSAGNAIAYRAAGIEIVEWRSVLDAAVDSTCEALHGQRWPLGQEQQPPAHVNCLPGNALVASGSRIAAASKRWYDGDMVVIRTASGKNLTCTPNHPILTHSGWVAAGSLNVGDHVISGLGQDGMLPARMHDEDVPTPIHEIAKSFRRSRSVTAVPVPTTAPDFHGDGAGSKVAVIYSDGLLMHDRSAPLGKQASKLAFIGRNVALGVPFARLGMFDSLTPRRSAPRGRDVRSGHLIGAAVARHLAPLQRLGVALPTDQYVGLLQSQGKSEAADSQSVRDGLKRFAVGIGLDEGIHFNLHAPVNSSRAQFDTQHSQSLSDDSMSLDAKSAANVLASLSGLVTTDEIIVIEHMPFSGHVYNLQTEDGWYVAEGIVTHNCRCWLSPVTGSGRALTKRTEPISDR